MRGQGSQRGERYAGSGTTSDDVATPCAKVINFRTQTKSKCGADYCSWARLNVAVRQVRVARRFWNWWFKQLLIMLGVLRGGWVLVKTGAICLLVLKNVTTKMCRSAILTFIFNSLFCPSIVVLFYVYWLSPYITSTLRKHVHAGGGREKEERPLDGDEKKNRRNAVSVCSYFFLEFMFYKERSRTCE